MTHQKYSRATNLFATKRPTSGTCEVSRPVERRMSNVTPDSFEFQVSKHYARGAGLGGGIGDVIAIWDPASGIRYPSYNHRGDVVLVTDANTGVVERNEYTAFGAPVSCIWNPASCITNPAFCILRSAFSSKEHDTQSGLSYYGFRYYDPASARWMNKDPILWEGGINMMRYERNSPLHHIDAYGRSPIVIGGLIALYEIALHKYLYVKAFEVFPDDECCPPRDRERHCWVNCMSVRIQGLVSYGSVTSGFIASIYKEGVDLVKGGDWHDTFEDMQANVYGMQVAYKVWKSCESHCVVCPYKR